MRKRIKRILRENDFEWVGHSEGREFRKWIHRRLEEYGISDDTLDDLEKFMADLPTDSLEDFIYTIQDLADNAFEYGKEEVYNEAYDEGHQDGYNEGYDEGLYDKDCDDECEDICQEKWDDGYQEGQNECEECD
jgi:hypothetical protein